MFYLFYYRLVAIDNLLPLKTKLLFNSPINTIKNWAGRGEIHKLVFGDRKEV